MKYSTRVLIGRMVISVCILLFSVIGITVAALMTKLTLVTLTCLLNGAFELSWREVLRSIKIGVIGGGILGVGINILRFIKVKGF